MHHQTSAYHPSSNGLVERGVRSLKDVLRKVKGPITKDLLDQITFALNNHPSPYQGTPNMRFLGRAPRSNLPNSMKRHVDREDLVKNRLRKQQLLAERKGRQSRDEFKKGDRVVVRDPTNRRWCLEGTVVDERKGDDGTPTSFIIKFDNGKSTIRHKSHMRFAIEKNAGESKVHTKVSWAESVEFSDGETVSLESEEKTRPMTRARLKRKQDFRTRWEPHK